jgi:hypothetical protein
MPAGGSGNYDHLTEELHSGGVQAHPGVFIQSTMIHHQFPATNKPSI